MLAPFNLKNWIDEHRHLLKPPVGNQQVFKLNDDFIVMVVGGPNKRKDFHWEEGEELFYQLEGDVVVRIINEKGEQEDVNIREGDMFLLPARVPHSPRRPAGTVGLVIERYRRSGEKDKLMWVCENTACNNLLYEASFGMKDIVAELPVVMKHFMDSEDLRTCKKCGQVMEAV